MKPEPTAAAPSGGEGQTQHTDADAAKVKVEPTMMEKDMSYDRTLEFNPHGSKAGDVRKRIPKIIGTDGAEREPFLLASWKICAFSEEACDEKYLKRIADTVKEFDLVAIQDVRDREVLTKLKAELDTDLVKWKFTVSKGKGGLYLAFMYRSDVVQMLPGGANFVPEDNVFSCKPITHTFKVKALQLELTVMNVHLSSNEEDALREAEALTGALRSLARGTRSGRKLVLLGNFNLSPLHVRLGKHMIAMIYPEPTMVSNGLCDNIWLDANKFTGRNTEKWTRYQLDSGVLQMKGGSCHFPVWTAFTKAKVPGSVRKKTSARQYQLIEGEDPVLCFLNTASEEELRKLVGVGEKTAERIRDRHFKSRGDLRKIKYIGDIRYDSIITQIEILQRSSSVTKERGEEIGDQAKQDCAEEDIPKVTPFPEVAAVEKQQETPKEISNSAIVETRSNADQQSESTSTCQGCGGIQQSENAVEYFGAVSCGSGVDNVRDSIERVSGIEGATSELLRVASWNICQLSNRKKRPKDTLNRIANIINEFDIVAIQEIRHEEVLDALIDPYLPGWGYVHSWPSNQSGYIEYLAFMYRSDAVKVVPGPYFDDEASDFSRRPIACTFQATKKELQKLELTLVNVHLPANREDALKEVAGFEQALTQLAGEMTINGKLCVLGDFNLSPLEAGLGKQMAALIYPLQTTIFGSRYDEIWLDKNDFTASSAQGNPRSSRYLIYSGVLRIDEIYYRDKNRTMVTRAMEQTFKNEVSDHLPVWAAFQAVQ